MKRAIITTVVLAFGTALATAALAQGRHDEKPHGSIRPTAASPESVRVPVWGGRHDERPHGPRQAAATTPEPKAGTEVVPGAADCCK